MGKKIPEKCISVEEAKELQKVWCDTRTPEIDKCLGFEDAREFHWSVKELRKYLKYVKKQSKKQGIKNPGIRIYFGAYPKEQCKMDRGYATAFLAPTGSPAGAGKDGDSPENNYTIAPYNRGGNDNPPAIY
ncbi:hypothetical protein AWE51_20020 [Aquimarina aggregata]|uniref:Uncharacterized protein n=1 Tax=Aquimarina aggregata TaxID=1642818 RepID=A0A163BRY7_9FLAO|nr:hypothetical protein [Aquimarina aggregata]KZS41687.1 hypothetical protein AWE51_20020 [Aquimarina aggregata]